MERRVERSVERKHIYMHAYMWLILLSSLRCVYMDGIRFDFICYEGEGCHSSIRVCVRECVHACLKRFVLID